MTRIRGDRRRRGTAATVPLAVGGLIAPLITGCSWGPTVQTVPIPPGVPPGPGAPVPTVDLSAPGRTADQLTDWATPIAETTRIPVSALKAYGNAAETMRQTRPECGLAWTTLAGIGWVETRHGTYKMADIDDSGQVSPPIIGIKLDGSPGFENIPDSDGGALDGDTEHDRAVGPMQFIPQSWQRYGRDANGDGRIDPNHIDDAAVAAARLLCDTGGDLTTADGWQAAVLTYNRSNSYVLDVRDAASAYSVGTRPP